MAFKTFGLFLLLLFSACAEESQTSLPQLTPLEIERENLRLMRQDLEALQAQYFQQQQDQERLSSSPIQITQLSQEIRDLNDDLAANKALEAQIQAEHAAALGGQGEFIRAQREQIDGQMQNLSEDMQRTREQMASLTLTLPTMPENRDELENVANTLASQQQQMQELRSAKSNTRYDVFMQSRSIASQAQQARMSLQEDNQATQSRIADLREEIERLKDERNTVRTSSMSLAQQIRQQQVSIATQEKRVQELEQAN